MMRLRTSLYQHRRALIALGGGFAIAAFGLISLWPVPLEERVERIHPGMTVPEVEAVMGLPPGNYSSYSEVHRGDWFGPADEWSLQWAWDDASVTVWFESNGRVIRTKYTPRDPPPLLDRVREWID